jgi:hypothetical protein
MATNTHPPITATVIDHEPVEFIFDQAELGQAELSSVTIPVVVGFNPDGTFQTAADLARRQRIDPADCDHAGATWSSNIALRCPKCGSPMFLPPRLLARLHGSVIAAMDAIWSAAGWPEWHGESWSIIPDKWTIMSHPLFDHCDGIPVRNDRLEQYYDVLTELAEDDEQP